MCGLGRVPYSNPMHKVLWENNCLAPIESSPLPSSTAKQTKQDNNDDDDDHHTNKDEEDDLLY